MKAHFVMEEEVIMPCAREQLVDLTLVGDQMALLRQRLTEKVRLSGNE